MGDLIGLIFNVAIASIPALIGAFMLAGGIYFLLWMLILN